MFADINGSQRIQARHRFAFARRQHQLDQRFAILKVEYDSAAQEQENAALLRQNAATGSALAQSRRVRQLQGVVIALGVALGAVLIWLVILNRGRARRMGKMTQRQSGRGDG